MSLSSFRKRFVLCSLVVSTGVAFLGQPESAVGQLPVASFLFGARDLEVDNPNNPGTTYTMVLHDADDPSVYDDLEYDAGRGYGFEVHNPDDDTDDRFGPFDNSPNNRNKWLDDLPDQAYDSFIGFKDFFDTCDESLFGNDVEDTFNEPCAPTIDADGGTFRVDVPNGDYRFVGVFGDADNVHAHRVLAQNGGSGPPADGAGDHVVLVHNHDQAQQVYGEGDEAEPGEGAYALVGFDDKLPPMPTGEGEGFPVPRFASMDENGFPILDANGDVDIEPKPNSPTLTVTEGYIRLHLLQGNSNDGDGGPRDPNGGDIVFFEIFPVTSGPLGDFNGNGMLDTDDIDQLNSAAAGGTNPAQFDLTGDGLVNADDVTKWIKDPEIGHSYIGDANYDREFNSGDLVEVFQKGLYETGQPAAWSEGDWNADGLFNSGDFVVAFQDGGYELGPLDWPAPQAVPEPSGIMLLGIGLLGLLRRQRR